MPPLVLLRVVPLETFEVDAATVVAAAAAVVEVVAGVTEVGVDVAVVVEDNDGFFAAAVVAPATGMVETLLLVFTIGRTCFIFAVFLLLLLSREGRPFLRFVVCFSVTLGGTLRRLSFLEPFRGGGLGGRTTRLSSCSFI